jgi:general secretion pathway protein E
MSGRAGDSVNATGAQYAESVFPVSVALACRVAAIAFDGETLTLLCDAASDKASAEAFAFRIGARVIFQTVGTDILERELEKRHGASVGRQGEAIGGSFLLSEDAAPYSTGLRQHYVESIVARAIADRASDIHIQPSADALEIRLRIDGRLRTIERLPPRMAAPLIAQIKVLARLQLAEKRLPQDGRFSLETDGNRTDLRVSILPSIHGEAAVLRVEDDVAPTTLAELGMPDSIVKPLEILLRRKGGLILVGGPTGSGKTTTLYAIMRGLNDAGSKLLSVEDPVERTLPGVNQVPVEVGGMGFGESIRAMLRHSPDAIMIGEIRDFHTAAAACEAALTGHLVIASAHARDAMEVAIRVADLGVSRQVLSCVLEATLTQRLVRVLCPECSRPAAPNALLAKALGIAPDDLPHCREAVGCPACGGTGYKGRRAIFGFAAMNDDLRKAVASGAGALALRKLASDLGMPTLTDSARRLAVSGVTSPAEAALSTNLDDEPASS